MILPAPGDLTAGLGWSQRPGSPALKGRCVLLELSNNFCLVQAASWGPLCKASGAGGLGALTPRIIQL
jgi:hypothetical protein